MMKRGSVYRFGRFVLNLERGCLQDGQADLDLRPKSFEVLRQLIEHAGRLMSKDELVSAVWPDVTVSDDSLAHCIRDIRKVLADADGQFVRTVPRRGYMFVAPVTSLDPGADRQDVAAIPGRESDAAKFERGYCARLQARYGEDAAYFVPLSGETTEAGPADAVGVRSAGRRRRLARPEYHEWLRSGDEFRRIRLDSLRAAVDRYPCIILLGDPGCGKTSALESLVYEFSIEGSRLPVPLYLSSLGSTESFEDFVARNWMNLAGTGAVETKELVATLQRYLELGRFIFLFDALNEMPRDRYREHCLALRQFIDRWSPSGNRFVVSCRVLDYGDELFGLQRVEIQPLSDEKIRRLIENELPDSGQSLWRALTESSERSRRLLEMARNPYLLTVMIDVFEEDGELTQDRAELMRRFVGILVNWARAKGPAGAAISPDIFEPALSAIAFEMQRRSGFGAAASTEDVKAVIPREVQITPGWPSQPVSPDALLSLATSAKIIEMPAGRRTVRFYHQLLQEFFAAQQLLKLDPAQLSDLWRWPWSEDEMPLWIRPENNFDPLPPPPQTGWEETTVLAAGLAPPNEGRLVQALLRINPVLAARCVLDTRSEIDSAIRRRLVDELLSVIGDPAVALRVRIVAGDALGRLGDPRAGEMVVVPSGTFLMGEGRERHEVFLPEFHIGRFPVTNAEYARFIEAGGYQDVSYWTQSGWRETGKERDEPRFWQDPRFNKPNQPVIGLSWYECVSYCRWLSSQTGQPHRLPTEAEWEKAARGADGRAYPWGDFFDASRLNAREGPQKAYCSTPVGIYPTGVSPFGLFDCAGNCWEWCATRWKKPFPYDAAEDEWAGAYLEGQNLRVLRGGSWNYEAEVTQCAYRFRFEPFGWNDRGGFRLVCSPPR
jgi:formylglycine-generating enzyme required for sulfatase activity/DNA-binding winged helix-turn-helix (wHTH) protein